MKFRKFLLWIFQVANYDFCPNYNVFFYWLKKPLGWVISAIAFSLLVGVIIGPQGYILAFSFLALLVLGLAWPWLSMKGVRCQLILPDRRVEENQELEMIFRVTNFWPLPIFGLMIKGEFLQGSDDGESVAFALKRVGAWTESEFRIPITPRRRGKLPTGEVTVANGFPFGLMDIAKTVDAFRPALVWPSSVTLDGFPVSDSTRFCLRGTLRDKAGNSGDSIGVRPYRAGDRLRNIHWTQSARSQKLMSRERQSISSTTTTVFLDLSPNDHTGHGVESSYEWTIRIAASICTHMHETHSPVQVVSFGLPEQSQICEDNRNGLRPIMDFLASLPSLPSALKMKEELELSNDAESQQMTSIHTYTRESNGHLFAVGTNQSKSIQSVDTRNLASNVTPIVVESDGFKIEDDMSLFNKASGGESRSSNSESIAIKATQSAAKDLVSGWDRSFSDSV